LMFCKAFSHRKIWLACRHSVTPPPPCRRLLSIDSCSCLKMRNKSRIKSTSYVAKLVFTSVAVFDEKNWRWIWWQKKISSSIHISFFFDRLRFKLAQTLSRLYMKPLEKIWKKIFFLLREKKIRNFFFIFFHFFSIFQKKIFAKLFWGPDYNTQGVAS